MELARKLATAGVTLALALGAGRYMEGYAQRADAPAERPERIEATAATAIAAPALRIQTPPLDQPTRLTLPVEAPVPAPLNAQAACTVTLDLATEPAAVLAVSLHAACHAGERVVLRHAGLAVTGRVSDSGHLLAHLPALDAGGSVSVRFGDGTTVAAARPVPEIATLRRFGVQWIGEDAFQVHALSNGARHGDPGHVSAVDPRRTGDAAGFLSLLGDAGVAQPMLAEVYTYPADGAPVAVQLEAAVTDRTCGHELLAETLASVGGRPHVAELTLAMPGCDAVGDYIVLKNLPRTLTMAASG